MSILSDMAAEAKDAKGAVDWARKAYEALGGGGIPFVDVNGTLIRDYRPEQIMAALK